MNLAALLMGLGLLGNGLQESSHIVSANIDAFKMGFTNSAPWPPDYTFMVCPRVEYIEPAGSHRLYHFTDKEWETIKLALPKSAKFGVWTNLYLRSDSEWANQHQVKEGK